MKTLKSIMILALAVCMFACGGSSTVGGIGGEKAINSDLVQILGLHYYAHQLKLTDTFQLSSNSEAMSILENNKQTLANQKLTSNYLNVVMKMYAAACSEVSPDVIPMDGSVGFKDIYYLMTGLVAGPEEDKLAQDIQAQLGSKGDDYVAFGNCLASATSLYSISALSKKFD